MRNAPLSYAPLIIIYISLVKLRRFRAVPTVEMLRTTWEKTSHPLVCFIRLERAISI